LIQIVAVFRVVWDLQCGILKDYVSWIPPFLVHQIGYVGFLPGLEWFSAAGLTRFNILQLWKETMTMLCMWFSFEQVHHFQFTSLVHRSSPAIAHCR